MTNVKNLVRNGKVQDHPIAGMFRSWLRGRKPTIILAFFWLRYAEGLLYALQHDLGVQMGMPQTMTRARVYVPKPETKTHVATPKWWEEVA